MVREDSFSEYEPKFTKPTKQQKHNRLKAQHPQFTVSQVAAEEGDKGFWWSEAKRETEGVLVEMNSWGRCWASVVWGEAEEE
ncbi:hypothetical protein E2C01_074629 [Portunus trituberculatus]|uniref:Uncharacterized protein n=1 Tax=Portunus trituberculatus TaxID=210409 RepID=A0A5B7IHQ9_PORTR|nr:hypothetical protein [Portunus trituberculatus]